MKLDEEQLLAACRKNDQHALKQLYDTYAPSMLGICMRYVRDRDDAQDVLHDGFIKILENLKDLKEPAALTTWIKTIMVNTAINYVRMSKSMMLDPLDEHTEDLQEDTMRHDEFRLYEPEQIVAAIQQLPDMQRLIFNLYEIEGYSDEELADEFHVKPTSIRSIVSRSRKQIFNILEKKH